MEPSGDIAKIMPIINSKANIIGTDTHGASLTGSAGTDTHSAGLSGSVSGVDPVRQGFVNTGFPTLSSLLSTDTQLGSVVLTPTESKNKIYLRVNCRVARNSGTIKLQIRESTTVLVNQDITTNVYANLSVVLTDVSVASHTYTFNIIANGGQYQYGVSCSTGANDRFTYEGLVFDITDTHAGSLSGSAGTDTHSGSLTGSNNQRTASKGVIIK
jgi:hypothetical protein